MITIPIWLLCGLVLLSLGGICGIVYLLLTIYAVMEKFGELF
jgi:hypothetical protein